MVRRYLVTAAAILILLGFGALCVAALKPFASTPPRTESVARKATVSRSPQTAPDSSSRVLVARDPFRVSRRPSAVAFGAAAAGPVATINVVRPTLMLLGVVFGEDATAVIEGFPGVEGARVVRLGDVVAGIRVRRIARDSVWLVGLDTVWALKVRQPW